MIGFEKWVKRASPRFEFFLVTLTAFGYFIVGSLFSLLFEADKVQITGRSFTLLLVYESVVLIALGWVLQKRSWTLMQLGFIPSWKSTLTGIGLVPAVYFLYVLVWILLSLLFPEIQVISQSKGLSLSGSSLGQIILVSVVNPVYEEIFVCGYIIHFLKKSKPVWIAVAIATLMRMLYHLYQPINGIVSIVCIGLIFGLFYAKTNRLWSVVIAHAIFDLWGLLSLKT